MKKKRVFFFVSIGFHVVLFASIAIFFSQNAANLFIDHKRAAAARPHAWFCILLYVRAAYIFLASATPASVFALPRGVAQLALRLFSPSQSFFYLFLFILVYLLDRFFSGSFLFSFS